MQDLEKLSFLVRLLDDDSTVVREEITRGFAEFGPRLKELLARLAEPPTPEQFEILSELLENHQKEKLRRVWPAWLEMEDDKGKLEAACTLLSGYLSGPFASESLKGLLDGLAEDYRTHYGAPDVWRLAQFLFETRGFRGAHEDSYYEPANSNLVTVIHTRRGIPISLACIYMMVGARLGLDIGGCNYPGHFLARAPVGGKIYLVDCYNGGRFIEEESLVNQNPKAKASATEVVRAGADAVTIVRRVLRNLIGAFQRQGREEAAAFMQELLDAVETDRE
ncbi:MAG TPA: transglutaminase-like domain-containing protein [Verrucomicrobiae bacterium]|nr:transglutaminase-like domain-containing protein [Verrucomicrobiae bacterium]